MNGAACGIAEMIGMWSLIHTQPALSGSAIIEFTYDTTDFELHVGDLARLTEGLRTTWMVTETPRKVSLTATQPATR